MSTYDIADRAGQDAAFGHGFANADADALAGREWLAGFPILDKLDAGDQADLADVANHGRLHKDLSASRRTVSNRRRARDRLCRLEQVQAGQGGGSAKLIGGKAVAMEEGLEFVITAEKGVKDPLGGQCRGHGKITAGHPFGHSHQIRLDGFPVAGKDRAGPAKAGHHFIGDQERAVSAGEIGGAMQPARGLRDHAGGALHQRLENKCGVSDCPFFSARRIFFRLDQCIPNAPAVFAGVGAFGFGAVERAAITIGRGHAVAFEKQTAVGPMKEINMPQADRADGVAMIRAAQRPEISAFDRGARGRRIDGPFSRPPRSPSNRRRKRRPVNFAAFCAGRHWRFDQFFRQERGRHIGQSQGGGMGDFAELTLDGRVDFRMAVAVQIGPDGGIGVQVFVAFCVAQGCALSVNNNNRLPLEPVAHLRERVPEILLIQLRRGQVCVRF